MNIHNSKQQQGASGYTYPGTGNLMLIETALTRYNEWVVDKFIKVFAQQAKNGTRILDFGSGIGTLSKLFYQKTNIRPDVFDLDLSHHDEMIKKGFHAFTNISDLPSTYDLIFTSNVLEHIEDDLGTLKLIRPHLRQDGFLLIYVPAFNYLWTPMDDMVGHIRRYSQKDLCRKLCDAGYVIKSTEYCDSIGFILSLFFKSVRYKNGHIPLKSLYIFDRFLLPLNKITDALFSRFFGKNLYVIAQKSM